MSFLGLFKKEAANRAQGNKPHPEIVTSTPTNTNQNAAPASDPFGGFVKFKTQPNTATNPFGTNSPSTVGSANQPISGSLYGPASQIKIDYSGLSPINPASNTFFSSDGESFGVDSQGDAHTPSGNNPIFKESPIKKSAFGFVKKAPAAKAQGNEAEQLDAFNILPISAGDKGESPFNANNMSASKGFESNDLLSMSFKKTQPSLATQAVDANNNSFQSTGSFPLSFKTKPNPFGKPAEQEQGTDTNKRRPSIDFTDDSKRKPSLAMDYSSQNEITSEKPDSTNKIETQNEPAPKKGGPAFMKFKQTAAAKQEEPKPKQQTPDRAEKFTDEEHAAISSKDESPKTDKAHQISRPIPIPSVNSQEDPNSLQARLEAERSIIMEKVGNLILKQNKIIANKESFEAQKDQLLNKVKDLGKQQNRAIEKDNFEEADRLEALIVQTNQKVKGVDQEIDNCQLQHAALEKEKSALYQQDLALYRAYLVNVEKAALSRNHVFEKYKLDCLNQQNTEKLYIDEEAQRLQLHRNHLDLDLKHIQEESSALEKNIEKQTKEYVQNQKDLSARKIDLELEIEQIKRELAAKEAELVSVSNSLEKFTNKISGVRAKFSDHLQRVQTKKEKSDTEEAQYSKELDRLNQWKSAAENNLRIYNETIGNHQKTMQAYEEFKNALQTESARRREENTERENALQMYYNSLNNLKEVKNILSGRTSEIEELKDGLHKIQKEIADINSQKSALDAKIPELEAEKKGYINSRSFKDASRISNDIKDIQTKIQELDQRLSELTSKDKLQLQKISSLEKNTIPQLSSKVETALRTCDLDKYNFLRTRERDLVSAYEYFSGKNQSKEANLVETELNEVQSQLKYLKAQYSELGGDHEEQHEEAHYDHQEHYEQPEEYQHDNREEEEEDTHQQGEYYQHEEHNQHHEEEQHQEQEEELGLAEYVSQYDEITQKIHEMEALIDQYATEEKYEEADEVASQQAELKQRQEGLLQNIQRLGYNDIEEARGAAGQY